MSLLALTLPSSLPYWPFAVLALSILFIVFAITVLRFHAFLALILAALLAGWLSFSGSLPSEMSQFEMDVYESVWELQPCTEEAVQSALIGPGETNPHVTKALKSLEKGKSAILSEKLEDGSKIYRATVAPTKARSMNEAHHGVETLKTVAKEFGRTAGGIGIVIALAAIIGMGLMESGAADKIVRCFIRFFGEKRGGVALLVSGFFLSIPVFFDTVFFLLIPLARAMAVRTGKNFMFYVLAIGGGGALTHSIVPPTPGPLLVADALRMDLGISIIAGAVAGVIPAFGIYFVAKWLDARNPVPLRETAGAPLQDLQSIISKKDEDLPSFWISILPVVLPVAIIALASFLDMADKKLPGVVSALGGADAFGSIKSVVDFMGNKTFALLMGALMAMGILAKQAGLSMSQLGEKLGPPLETAGVIILITSAGGAFGAMIRYAGVGDAIETVAEGKGLNYILLAWLVTAVVRVAQGSATVSMITASALMYAIIEDKTLPYNVLYIYLAIGFGSMILSWMNDSGFWVVGKLSGFTEKETLKTWTVVVTALSVMGLVEILILAKLFPLTGL